MFYNSSLLRGNPISGDSIFQVWGGSVSVVSKFSLNANYCLHKLLVYYEAPCCFSYFSQLHHSYFGGRFDSTCLRPEDPCIWSMRDLPRLILSCLNEVAQQTQPAEYCAPFPFRPAFIVPHEDALSDWEVTSLAAVIHHEEVFVDFRLTFGFITSSLNCSDLFMNMAGKWENLFS